MPWNYNPETGEPEYFETPVPEIAFAPVDQQNVTAINSGMVPTQNESPVPEIATKEALGVSHSGLDKSTFNQLEKQGQRQLPGLAGINAAADNLQYNQEEIGRRQRDATDTLGRLEADRTASEAKYTQDLATKQNQFVIDASKEYESAKQNTLKYAADYETQLKQLATMSVNPGRLYSSMSKGEKAGTLISAFVTDFLGAKGIKTSAMDTFNRAIQQDIDSQVMNIQNKRQVAEGFRNLWEMQRAQSTSDFEASLRMKGMVLEAFKTEVAGRLGQFDSDIARAKIPLALAQIDEKLNQHKADILKFKTDQFNQDANRRLEMRKMNLQASMHKDSVEMEKLRRQADAMKALAEKGKNVVRVSEPEFREGPAGIKIPTGKRVGRVLGFDRDPEEAAKFQTKLEGTQNALDMVETLRNFQKTKGGQYNWYGKTLTSDETESLISSVYNDLVSEMVKARSGLTVSDKEREYLQQVIPFADFKRGILSGDSSGDISSYVVSKFGLRQIEQANKSAEARLSKPSAEEMEYFKGGTSGPAFEGYKTSNETFNKTTDKTETEKLIGAVDSVGSSAGKREATSGTVAEDAKEFFSSIGKVDEFNHVNKSRSDDFFNTPIVATNFGESAAKEAIDFESTIPSWFYAMDELKNKAISQGLPPSEYNQIIDFFTNYSSRKPELPIASWNDPEDKDKAAAAEYFLNEILSRK